MKKVSYILLLMWNIPFYPNIIREKLEPYRSYLIDGTYAQQDWSSFSEKPLSRYETFLKAFELFEQHNGKIVVELGTTHSFVDGRFEGCDKSDIKYWQPNNPAVWDWGAGCFTLMAARSLFHLHPKIYTVDLNPAAIIRCKIMTIDYKDIILYHTESSERFLDQFPKDKKIDLLYLDTGYMNPIEPTAMLQLREAKKVIERNLLAPDGIILIDDVRNQNVLQNKSGWGKSKYAIPYLREQGFEIIVDGYQVIMKRKTH